MKCPNCAFESPDDAVECARCQLVFAKWKASSIAAVTVPTSAASGGGLTLDAKLLFGLFLSLAGYYWAYVRTPAAESDSDRTLPRGACAFSGELLDVYSLAPVSGARIAFGPKAAAVTDASGRYWVRLKGGEYQPSIAHPAYRPAYAQGFGRDWREAPFEQRVRAARSADVQATDAAPTAADSGSACVPGQETVLNFALIPKQLGAEDEAKIAQVP